MFSAVRHGTAQAGQRLWQEPHSKRRLSLAGAGSWQQDGRGTGAGKARQDCAWLLSKTYSGSSQGTCLDTPSLSQTIPSPLPLPQVLAGHAQAVCTSAFRPLQRMYAVPADSWSSESSSAHVLPLCCWWHQLSHVLIGWQLSPLWDPCSQQE